MNIPFENNAEQFYHTLSSIGDGVITSDLQGNVCFLNKTAEELTGFNRDEAIGNKLHHVFRIRIKEDTEPEDNPFQRALDSRRTVGLKRNTVLVTKQGEEKFISASHSPIKDNNGDITGVVVVFRDITSIRKAEDALQKAKDAAESANRAKSEFLANMSHEIRTPLNGIIGMTDLTLLTELKPEQRENLTIVKSCAEALMNVIHDILDFSKIEAGKMTIDCVEFDLDNLMAKMLKTHRVNAYEKGLELEYHKSEEVPEILEGDPFRLQQILNNLIGNAIKFTDFGSVGLQIGVVKKEKNELELKFSVSDTGIGIEAYEMTRLFKSFSQVDGSVSRKYGGTGLGLVISKRLVEMMEGSIWVESQKGVGSTFYFTGKFGYNRQSFPQESREPDLIMESTTGDVRILLADDDSICQLVAGKMVEDKGIRVRTADNGFEVLDILEREAFDLILMDIQMPVLDGIETTKRIREKEKQTGKRIPIVAVTAFALQGDKERFLAAGMDDYISKPIKMSELFKLVDKYVKGVSKGEEPSKASICKNDEEETGTIYMKKLAEAISSNDMDSIERFSNQIKSMAVKINNGSLKNAAFKIALAARKQDMGQIKKLYSILQDEFGNNTAHITSS